MREDKHDGWVREDKVREGKHNGWVREDKQNGWVRDDTYNGWVRTNTTARSGTSVRMRLGGSVSG